MNISRLVADTYLRVLKNEKSLIFSILVFINSFNFMLTIHFSG